MKKVLCVVLVLALLSGLGSSCASYSCPTYASYTPPKGKTKEISGSDAQDHSQQELGTAALK